MNAETEASRAPKKPEITPLDRYAFVKNDPDATKRVADAFRSYFPAERVQQTQPTTASEDFGSFGTDWHMQRTPRRATLGPKGLLTLANVCSAILLVGVASFFASGNARTEMNYEDNKVLVGAAAFGDWHNDAPGIRRLITARDLPEIGKDGPDYAEIVPRPAGAMPQVPDGFSVELVASGLAQARVIRMAPNGDLFVTNSSANEERSPALRGPRRTRPSNCCT